MSIPPSPSASADGAPRAAVVVFIDRVECPWLRGLERGFRHCFAALADDSGWLLCDPLKDRILLTRITPPAGFDLARFYCDQGHRVLVGTAAPASATRGTPTVAPLTCVAIVKRLLGVQAATVLTPRQLFRHLVRPPMGFVEIDQEGETAAVGLDKEGS
jgi:hypothetical protein